MTDVFSKWGIAFWGAVVSLFLEVESIMMPCLVFIGIDFILGVITDIKASLKKGEKFGIQSTKLWKTITKLMGVMLSIILTQLFTNSYIDWLGVNLGKMIAGVIASVELYSILGHICYISDWSGFKLIRKLLKKEIETKVGYKIEDNG